MAINKRINLFYRRDAEIAEKCLRALCVSAVKNYYFELQKLIADLNFSQRSSI